MMEKVLLSHEHWELQGYWPWVPQWGQSIETGQRLMGITDWIPAHVPGGVHLDLLRAGWISSPLVDTNSLTSEWVERRWWVYRMAMVRPTVTGDRIFVTFRGLDDDVTAYLNGTVLGRHEGPFEPARFDITDLYKASETLTFQILFHGAPEEMGQIGRTSLTRTQKPRFSYKWDFGTRLVNIGIWDDVWLEVHDTASILDVSVTSDVLQGTGQVFIQAHVQTFLPQVGALRWKIALWDAEDRLVAERMARPNASGNVREVIVVEEPQLWFPNGTGAQPLYRVQLSLFDDTRCIDAYVCYTGIRSLRFVANESSPVDALPYTVVVNDRPIYIKGVNVTPIDHLYGTVSRQRYAWLVRTMYDLGVNLVRVCGVGLIEREVFYALCDQYGIMVWQEFPQSSSGIDSVPSADPHFLELLRRTATTALMEKRNHVALSVWSGGNELQRAENVPVTMDDANIRELKTLVDTLDPMRLFVPTSASGPQEFANPEGPIGHDVHGPWKYLGNPQHYEFYSYCNHLLHSEFGADGMSAEATLKDFLSTSHQTPNSMASDVVWRFHGEWWDTKDRDQLLFGDTETLKDRIDCSQWIQAEAIRFAVESNRRHKFHNSGAIVWQLNEPWPNISNTCLMDYFGEKKMAYYWTRHAFEPIVATLDYRRLDYAVGSVFSGDVYVIADQPTRQITVKATVRNIAGESLNTKHYDVAGDPLHAKRVIRLQTPVRDAMGELFFVQLTTTNPEALDVASSVYVFSTTSDRPYRSALRLAENVRLFVKPLEDWVWVRDANPTLGGQYYRRYIVENRGTVVALHVRSEEITHAFWVESDKNFFSLFPGESTIVTIKCYPRDYSGLLQFYRKEADHPEIIFRPFCGPMATNDSRE